MSGLPLGVETTGGRVPVPVRVPGTNINQIETMPLQVQLLAYRLDQIEDVRTNFLHLALLGQVLQRVDDPRIGEVHQLLNRLHVGWRREEGIAVSMLLRGPYDVQQVLTYLFGVW